MPSVSKRGWARGQTLMDGGTDIDGGTDGYMDSRIDALTEMHGRTDMYEERDGQTWMDRRTYH